VIQIPKKAAKLVTKAEVRRRKAGEPVSTPLAPHFKLSAKQCAKTDVDLEYMSKVPYSSSVGSLMYALVCSRHYLSHAMSVVARYMSNLGKEHWKVVQWIFRYLCGSLSACLYFGKYGNGLIGYVDSDYGGDLDWRRSLCLPQKLSIWRLQIVL
jgi:hypothetical protein